MNVRRVFLSTLHADHIQLGMIKAFEGVFGPQAFHYDYLERTRETKRDLDLVNREFVENAIRWNPHWMWLQLQNTEVIRPESIEEVKSRLPTCVVTHWSGDVRDKVSGYFAGICRSAHLTLLANTGFLKMHEEAGARETMYVAHGVDWQEDILGIPDWEPPFKVPDVVYCGNHYGSSIMGTPVRESAVRALRDAGIDVGIVGNGWGPTELPILGTCHVKQQVHVYRRAKVALSVNHFPDLAGYHGDRTITAMASGTAVVQRHFPEIEKEFLDDEHLVVFHDEGELVSKVKGLLTDEPRRRRLGSSGRREVLKHHTWYSRIFQVLPRVEEIRKQLGGGS